MAATLTELLLLWRDKLLDVRDGIMVLGMQQVVL
jgi:hypothetical protein